MNSNENLDSNCPIVESARGFLSLWLHYDFFQYCSKSLGKLRGKQSLSIDEILSEFFCVPQRRPTHVMREMLAKEPINWATALVMSDFLWFCVRKALPAGIVKKISDICDRSAGKKIASLGTGDRRMIFYQLVAAVLDFNPDCNRGTFHILDSAVLKRNSTDNYWQLPFSDRQQELIIPFEEPPVVSATRSRIDDYINTLLTDFFLMDISEFGDNRSAKTKFISSRISETSSTVGLPPRFVFAVLSDTCDFIGELNDVLPSLPIVTKPTTADAELLAIKFDLQFISISLNSHLSL